MEEIRKACEEEDETLEAYESKQKAARRIEKRSRTRIGSANGGGGQSDKAPESTSDERAQEILDETLLKRRERHAGHDPSKGYFNGGG